MEAVLIPLILRMVWPHTKGGGTGEVMRMIAGIVVGLILGITVSATAESQPTLYGWFLTSSRDGGRHAMPTAYIGSADPADINRDWCQSLARVLTAHYPGRGKILFSCENTWWKLP